MATKNKNEPKRKNAVLKVQPQELDLTSLKELLQKSKVNNKRKKDKKGKFIGYFITCLGLLSLISSLLINRFGDREYFSDMTIIFIMGVSLFALLFGMYILIRETR